MGRSSQDGRPEPLRRLQVNVAGAVQKRSVLIEGHRTSVSLEPEFWSALKRIAAARGKPVGQLVAEIDSTNSGNLSSALRLFVLRDAEARALDR